MPDRHPPAERRALRHRIHRIAGQVEGIRRLLDGDDPDCGRVLQAITACRGALNGLMGELLAHHLDDHVLGRGTPVARRRSASELLAAMRSYLR